MTLTLFARELKSVPRFLMYLMLMAVLTPFRSSATETNSSPKTLDVRRYAIEDPDILTPTLVNSFFASAIGTNISIQNLQADLETLQKTCDQIGYDVRLIVPPQTVTNGTVRIQAVRRRTGLTETNESITKQLFSIYLPPTTNTPGYFQVNGYFISGNTVLRPDEFGYLSNYTGVVDVPRVKEGLDRLQEQYRDLGFPTVSVILPKQRLTNGLVHVRIMEGKISDIFIKGNRYYSAANIRGALPDLQTNVLLNTRWFEPELDIANGNQDRQIYPVIGPGPDPGTAALTLQVKDDLPLHGHVELDNRATPGTPPLRLDDTVQYNNLWQRDHQIGFQSSISPTELTDQPLNFYDKPMVANYSAFYRLPLNIDGSLRERYENLPVDFGYNEVTHQFSLPPPSGQPNLIFYASHASADGGNDIGPMSILSQSSSLLVNNQTYEHTVTENEGLGGRFILPLPPMNGIQSSLTAGLDYKYYHVLDLTTNITIANDLSNDVSVPIVITNESKNQVYYVPLTVGWQGAKLDPYGSTTFSANDNIFLRGLASSRSGFEAVAASEKAGGNYTTITADMDREQILPANWSLSLKAAGQWASEPLISNEEFPLGGTSSVRGYQEGEAYGDTGWHTQFELRAPAANVGYLPTEHGTIPTELRCSVFMDYGEAYSLSQMSAIREWGTGLGFFLTAGDHLTARLQLAWELHETPLTPAGTARAYFSLGAQF